MPDTPSLPIRLPAEWESQSGVMLTWPHANSDWKDTLDDVIPVFANLAREISLREKVLIAAANPEDVYLHLAPGTNRDNLLIAQVPSNDTWARDHGPITVWVGEEPVMLDFRFNAWGMKFASDLDNLITRRLFHDRDVFAPKVRYANAQSIVLEGGSIESDGRGTLLVTSSCLLSENRNEWLTATEIEDHLCRLLGARRVLWLNNGSIDGDDTDGHVDTLARFCPDDTIAYVAPPENEDDEDFYDLSLMCEELKSFRTLEGNPYHLVALPSPSPVIEDGRPLPATYANFLIINGAVLMPTYRQSDNDRRAAQALQTAFPDRQIIPVDCLPVIRQNGSLHCLTMQLPKGVLI